MMDIVSEANNYCDDFFERLAQALREDNKPTITKEALHKATGIPTEQIVNGVKNGNLDIGWYHSSKPGVNPTVTIFKVKVWAFFTGYRPKTT